MTDAVKKHAFILLSLTLSALGISLWKLLFSVPTIENTQELVISQQTEIENVVSLSFSNDGKYLYSGYYYRAGSIRRFFSDSGGMIARWNLETGKVEESAYLPFPPVSLSISESTNKVAIGGAKWTIARSYIDRSDVPEYQSGGEVRFVDSTTLREEKVLSFEHAVISVLFLERDDLLAVLSVESKEQLRLSFWDISDFSEVKSLSFQGSPPAIAHAGCVRPMICSKDKNYLLVATRSSGRNEKKLPSAGKMAMVDLNTLESLGEFELEHGPVTFLDLSDDDKLLSICSGTNAYVAGIDFGTRQLVNLRYAMVHSAGVLFLPGGYNMIGAYRFFQRKPSQITCGSVFSFGVFTKEDEWPSPSAFLTTSLSHGWTYAMAVSRDGSQVAFGGQDGAVRLWQIPADLR